MTLRISGSNFQIAGALCKSRFPLVNSVVADAQARVAVLLPAFNEELTIEATIEAFCTALPDAAIWVVNNRSTDGTERIARAALARLGCPGGVLSEQRPGKGNAVRRGFMDIDADVYVLVDADMTYPADEVHNLIAPVQNDDADMVVGDRHSAGHYEIENKRTFHGFGNRLIRDLVNRLFGSNLRDIMSGYRVLNRKFVKSYPILVEGFEIETDMTLHALDKRFRVVEVPIRYRDRPEGSLSKLNTYRDGARVIQTVGNIFRYYRPLAFFGLLSLMFFLLGVLAGMPVLDEWITFSYIRRVPLAVLAAGLEIVACVLFAIGLILDSIVHQDKRNFERSLLRRPL